jgi:DHA3 family macrolide efflux protein-like MFS transporter
VQRVLTRLQYPALSNRRFVRLLLGDTISQFGNTAYVLAASFWLYHLTGQVSALASLWLARVVARLCLQPFAGALVDRWDRRRTFIVANLTSGLLVALFPLSGRERVYLFYVLTALVQGANDFLAPAFSAWLPDVTGPGELLSANALLGATAGAVGFLGPALMGLLYRRSGPAPLFWLDALSFGAAALSAASVREPITRQVGREQHGQSLLRETTAGLQWMWVRPLMRTLLLLVLVNSVMWRVLEIVLVPLTDTRWQVGPAGLGVLFSLLAVGQVLSGMVLGRTSWSGGRMAIALAFAAQALLLLTVAAGPPVADGGIAAAGFVAGIAFAWNRQFLQTRVPESLRGRAFSTLSMATAIGVLPALLLLAPVTHAIGDVGAAVASIVLLLGVSTLLAVGRPAARSPRANTAG